MYSFIYEAEPGIIYNEREVGLKTWLGLALENRLLNEFLTIIGSEKEVQRLCRVGAEMQNIVQIVDKDSGEILQQIPGKDVVERAKYYREISGS